MTNPYITAQIIRYAAADEQTREASKQHWLRILIDTDPITLPEPACIADLAARNLALIALIEHYESQE